MRLCRHQDQLLSTSPMPGFSVGSDIKGEADKRPDMDHRINDGKVLKLWLKLLLSGAIFKWELLEAPYLLLSLLLIGCIMFISFVAFQILIRWLIYCLAGFNQLAPNIETSLCLHGFLSVFSSQAGSGLCILVCVCVCVMVGGYRLIWQCSQPGLAVMQWGKQKM